MRSGEGVLGEALSIKQRIGRVIRVNQRIVSIFLIAMLIVVGFAGVVFMRVIATPLPMVDANGPYGTHQNPLYEGEIVTFNARIINGNAADYQFRWDVTGDGEFDGPGPAPDFWGLKGETDYSHQYLDDYYGEAKVEAWDGINTLSDNTDVWVENVPPTVFNVTATPDSEQQGQPVEFTAQFEDPGLEDSWYFRWDFGDGQYTDWMPTYGYMSTEPVFHRYLTIGTFEPRCEVRDDDHERGLILNTPQTLDFQDFEGIGFSWPQGWYEGGLGGWQMHYAYKLNGTAPFLPYWCYGISILYSPIYNFSGLDGAVIEWDNYWDANWPTGSQDGYVQVSVDGGSTWVTLQEFHHLAPSSEVAHYQRSFCPAANEPWVQFRFWCDMYDDWYWEIDNIHIMSAELYALNGIGSASTNVSITYNNHPFANAGGPFYSGFEGSAITLDASASMDPDGHELFYRWDFESDGIWDTGWSANPIIEYAYPDDYDGLVAVGVSDDYYHIVNATAEVDIFNVAPEVYLSFTPENP
ncbi:MAG: hypothetical protein JSW28_00925, partial [Thermoplasmata archaeon]